MLNLPREADPKDPVWRNKYLRQLGLDPGAIYQELEMDSRFVDTYRDAVSKPAAVSLHSHDFYEILYCRSAGGVEYLVDAERYRLKKGDVVLIPPGVSHRPLFPEEMPEPYVRDVLWVSREFVDQLMHIFPDLFQAPQQYVALLQMEEDAREPVAWLFEQGIREDQHNLPERELALMSYVMQLVVQLRRSQIKNEAMQIKAEKTGRLHQVLQFIENNLDKKITLEEVARRFFVSESTITQMFRRRLGVSFYRCVIQRRLIAAKTLIGQGVALECVSEQVGFADYSAFYRAFKKEYGISPTQYRKLLRNFE
jgi:AraC-like DNA-binding protein